MQKINCCGIQGFLRRWDIERCSLFAGQCTWSGKMIDIFKKLEFEYIGHPSFLSALTSSVCCFQILKGLWDFGNLLNDWVVELYFNNKKILCFFFLLSEGLKKMFCQVYWSVGMLCRIAGMLHGSRSFPSESGQMPFSTTHNQLVGNKN